MKIPIGIAAALMVSMGWAQMPDTKVTADIPAGMIGKVLGQLGQTTNTQFQIDREVASDIVTVHVKDAPLNEVMEKIAIAVTGRWSQEGSVWKLYPDGAKRNLQAKAEADERAKDLLKAIVEMEKPYQKPKPEEGEPEYDDKMGRAFKDSQRAQAAIMRQIGVNFIASLLPADRVVFSTTPTPMQKAITINPAHASAIVAYHNLTHSNDNADTNEGEDFLPPGFSAELAEAFKFLQSQRNVQRKKITVMPTKVIVTLAFDQGMAGLFGYGGTAATMTIRMYDAQGKVVLEEGSSNRFGGMMEAVAVPTEISEGEISNEKEQKVDPDKSPKIEFSARAKEIAKFMGSNGMMMGDPSTVAEMNTKLSPYFTKPYELDPLELIHGEAFRNFAKQKNINFVACIPDSLVMETQILNGTTINMVERILSDNAVMSGEFKDGWGVSWPHRAFSSRRSRIDRLSLQALVQSAQDKPDLNLDEAANFAFANPHANENQLPMVYATFGLKGLFMNTGFTPTNWETMKLFGSLPAHQRNTFRNSGRIPFSELGPDSRKIVNEMVYGAVGSNFEAGKPVEMPAVLKDNPLLSQMFAGGLEDGPHTSFLDEPTEALPNGLPTQGFIQITAAKSTCLNPVDAKGKSNPIFSSVDTSELGLFQVMMSSDIGSQLSMDLSRFKVGERTHIDISINLRPELRIKAVLQDDVYSKDGTIYTEATLPTSLQNEIAAKKEKMKIFEKLFQGGMGMGNGGKPPF